MLELRDLAHNHEMVIIVFFYLIDYLIKYLLYICNTFMFYQISLKT